MSRHLMRPVGIVIAALVTVVTAWTATSTLPAGAAARAEGHPPVVALVVAPAGPSVAGESVTLTATVTVPPGEPDGPEVTGHVQFLDTFRGERLELGTVALDDGVAEVVTTLLRGRHTFEAHYLGDPTLDRPPAQSGPVAHDVVSAVSCPEESEGHRADVRLVYMNLLGRCPDPAGFAYWVGRLEGGAWAADFARAIAYTPEALGRVVDDAYRTMLGRRADGPGRAHWTGLLQRHGRYDQLLADLGASPEFWTLAGGTHEGFVIRVYDRLLRRAPDPPGRDHWIGRLDGGTSPRSLVRMVANQDEVLGRLVTQSYYEILDHGPEPHDRDEAMRFLRLTGDRSLIYAFLVYILTLEIEPL